LIRKFFSLPLFLICSFAFLVSSAFATCTTNSAITAVQAKICAPVASATVLHAFHFSAADSSKNGITVAQLYIDGVKQSDYFVKDVEVDVTLAPGTHYLAFNAIDKKNLKAAVKETITVRPPQVALSWRPSTTAGVDSYIVYRSLRSGGGYAQAGTTGTTTSFVDKPGIGTFYYVVAAVSPKGESPFSGEVKVIVK
jgi:hypothetical protein